MAVQQDEIHKILGFGETCSNSFIFGQKIVKCEMNCWAQNSMTLRNQGPSEAKTIYGPFWIGNTQLIGLLFCAALCQKPVSRNDEEADEETTWYWGFLHSQGSVKILMHGHKIQHDAQWKTSQKDTIRSWHRFKSWRPRHLCENPCCLWRKHSSKWRSFTLPTVVHSVPGFSGTWCFSYVLQLKSSRAFAVRVTHQILIFLYFPPFPRWMFCSCDCLVPARHDVWRPEPEWNHFLLREITGENISFCIITKRKSHEQQQTILSHFFSLLPDPLSPQISFSQAFFFLLDLESFTMRTDSVNSEPSLSSQAWCFASPCRHTGSSLFGASAESQWCCPGWRRNYTAGKIYFRINSHGQFAKLHWVQTSLLLGMVVELHTTHVPQIPLSHVSPVCVFGDLCHYSRARSAKDTIFLCCAQQFLRENDVQFCSYLVCRFLPCAAWCTRNSFCWNVATKIWHLAILLLSRALDDRCESREAGGLFY